MMNRIEQKFAGLRSNNETALVGFVTAGDPDIIRSESIIAAMCENGIDVLELGIPFSDPTADGPAIQKASARALSSGIRMNDIFSMVERFKKRFDTPVVLFSYYNPIHAYGGAAFYSDAVSAGADGLLVVDLPPEESSELTCHFKGHDLPLIRLIAPTTPEKRMAMIAKNASGFIYLVSKTGVTGSAGLDFTEIGNLVTRIRGISDLPVCVGFGISTARDVYNTARLADGVVIGSAFVRTIEEKKDDPDLAQAIGAQARGYKDAALKAHI